MKKLAALIIVAAMIYGCTSDNLEDLHPVAAVCDTVNMKFSVDILPIMQSQCGAGDHACHQNDMASGGYGLADAVTAKAAVINSEADYGVANTFMSCIRHTPGTGLSNMPKNAGKLDDCSINKIQAWIDNGMQNN